MNCLLLIYTDFSRLTFVGGVFLQKKRVVAFDIISIIGCSMVCIVHFNASVCGYSNGTFIIPENAIVPNFILHGRVYLGTLGVSMFFMLSGARLMYNYTGGWGKAILY